MKSIDSFLLEIQCFYMERKINYYLKSLDEIDGIGHRLVHGKDKDTCPECNTKIEKIRVGGRGTYYCPNCQK